MIRKLVKAYNSSVITLPDSSDRAYLTAQLFKSYPRIFVITKDKKEALVFIEQLKFFLPYKNNEIIFFPEYHILPFKSLSYQKDISVERLSALSQVMNLKSFIVVASVNVLIPKLIPKKSFNKFEELIIANEEIDIEELISKLESGGYKRVSLVEEKGEYSVRGGILDIFSPQHKYPVRIELFGDLVESMRNFSIYTQRGFKDIHETIIIPASESIITKESLPYIIARLRQAGVAAKLDPNQLREYVNKLREEKNLPEIYGMLSFVYEDLDTFFDYLPSNILFVVNSSLEIKESALDFETKSKLNFKTAISQKKLCVKPELINLKFEEIKLYIQSKKNISFKQLDIKDEFHTKDQKTFVMKIKDNLALSSLLKEKSVKETPLSPLVDWINEHLNDSMRIFCILSQEAQAKRLLSLLQPYGIAPLFCESFEEIAKLKRGIYYMIGNVLSGFVYEEKKIALVTENEIFGKKRIRRKTYARKDISKEFVSAQKLKTDDIVVHVEHGIGQYKGIVALKIDGISQDFILIYYRDDDKLYLPVDRVEMIGKYVGIEGYQPILDKIGSLSWNKSKKKAKKEVEKLAAELLELYAKRRVNKGFAFSKPDNYYNEFEALFPYEETRDQLKAIDDVNIDMESSTPMDRLVCGDVGYGKTEVAIRASFKAINDGKQVAIVVPTTILAEQHLTVFKSRFENYPVNIECLSRFRSPKQQIEILRKIRSGIVDIVIGTHRLLQNDVEFKFLGLLVIDEEQRFGVKHKEKLKKKRSNVDVLALTATPIPRTLHMSLTGLRDISIITTPPADRQSIVSYISKYEEPIVTDAIRKEIDRNGQTFFVHNNIKTIFKTAKKLQELVPNARIAVAHGRLLEKELEDVMFKFVNFQIDVLVCTTIIESGLDIPSANTMIINKVEQFGLAQIYQLRGRIGRGDYQAYAYLFAEDETRLTNNAKKRLSALMEHKDLGSGFQIAMKDLQIRGAGTALGASQSGHIAAVGYDMFLKLLDQTILDLKGEDVIEPLEPEINIAMSVGFPENYIDSVEQRLTIYRRLSRIKEISEISDMRQELIDRYGEMPEETKNMLIKIMLRVYSIKAGIKVLNINSGYVVLTFAQEHQKHSIEVLHEKINITMPAELIKKDSIKIDLTYIDKKTGRKQKNIVKALFKTKEILHSILSIKP